LQLQQTASIESMGPYSTPVVVRARSYCRRIGSRAFGSISQITRSADDIGAFERAIGTNDLLPLGYFWAGLAAARSVGHILIAPVPSDPGGSATGFMIAPNLLLTNWHVFPKEDVAQRGRVQFAYEAGADGNRRVST
jgi:hypothetical protein